jgi:hypothetical protein
MFGFDGVRAGENGVSVTETLFIVTLMEQIYHPMPVTVSCQIIPSTTLGWPS